jgi:hypothetical protein
MMDGFSLAEKGRFRFVGIRDARWFVFRPKIQIWVNLEGCCDGRCWYIILPFGLFTYVHLAYFTAIWCILRQFTHFGKL